MTTFRSCFIPGWYPAILHLKTSYLSQTETTDFRSGSVQFTAESTKKSPIYDRVNQNSPIFGRVNRVRLSHGFGRMSEVGRLNK